MDDSGRYKNQDILRQAMVNMRDVVEERKREVPLPGIRALATMQTRPYDLSSTIRYDGGISLLVHVKRTSPDMDSRIENYDPVMLAVRFAALGAKALAISTNEKFYHGGIADLTLVSQNVKIPVIRQDFVYDEYQIVEARAAGADAVLLIAHLLEPEQLRSLISITQRNRMNAVVQVQNEDEVRTAIRYEPRVIAISNRDMRNFRVDFDRTLRLRPLIPSHMAVISMGGLRRPEHLMRVAQANIDAVIIGQALLQAEDTAKAISEFFQMVSAEPLDVT